MGHSPLLVVTSYYGSMAAEKTISALSADEPAHAASTAQTSCDGKSEDGLRAPARETSSMGATTSPIGERYKNIVAVSALAISLIGSLVSAWSAHSAYSNATEAARSASAAVENAKNSGESALAAKRSADANEESLRIQKAKMQESLCFFLDPIRDNDYFYSQGYPVRPKLRIKCNGAPVTIEKITLNYLVSAYERPDYAAYTTAQEATPASTEFRHEITDDRARGNETIQGIEKLPRELNSGETLVLILFVPMAPTGGGRDVDRLRTPSGAHYEIGLGSFQSLLIMNDVDGVPHEDGDPMYFDQYGSVWYESNRFNSWYRIAPSRITSKLIYPDKDTFASKTGVEVHSIVRLSSCTITVSDGKRFHWRVSTDETSACPEGNRQ